MEQKHVLLVVAGGVVAVLGYYYTPWLLYPLFLVMSVACGATFALLRGGYELRRVQTQPKPPVTRTFAVLSRLKVYPAPTLRPTLLSANVDSHIQGVLELVLKHHVIPTYNIVATDHKAYFNTLIPELWNVLHILLNRVSHVDTIKLVSQDVVEAMRKHFVPFRGFQVNNPLPPGVTLFPDISQFPYLVSPEKEREFLQKAVDVLLCACLPNEYLKCAPVRVIIREYLVSNIVQPTIDRVCEPDYINRKILAYLVRKEENTSVEKKYAYSDYEEFMTYLQKCEDVTELSQIRQSIIMDIMQAKAVQHMRETSTGLRMAQLPVTIPAEKAKMLMERDLSLYINQLNTAKNKCERRIRKLGGELHQQQLAQSVESDRIIQDFPLPIPFDSIMHNETAFMYFVKYLDQYSYSSLPLFWKAVQNLRETPPHDIIHRLHSVYTEYLCQGATNPIHTDFETVQEIEKTLSHTELCLAAMRKLQDSVYTELHQQFYTSFLHSQSFKEFMDCEAEQESGALFHQKMGSQAASPSLEETSYQKRLKFLQQRVSQKEAAIAAMPPSATKRREKLMRDKAVLEEEIKRVVHYIGHTGKNSGCEHVWA